MRAAALDMKMQAKTFVWTATATAALTWTICCFCWRILARHAKQTRWGDVAELLDLANARAMLGAEGLAILGVRLSHPYLKRTKAVEIMETTNTTNP